MFKPVIFTLVLSLCAARVADAQAGGQGKSKPAACKVASDCNDNNACTSETCVDRACRSTAVSTDDGIACTTDQCDTATGTISHLPPPGTTVCASGCVSLATDLQNCGACGNVCPAGARCSNAKCVCPDLDLDRFAICGTTPVDCDDANARVHPGAAELCNAKDDDCNGAVDDKVTDLPRSGECLVSSCANGSIRTAPAPTGQVCLNGTGVCNSTGTCVLL